jgi:YtcA family
MPSLRRVGATVIVAAFAATLFAFSGCDPVVNIAGANFPAWLLCSIVGAILMAVIRPLFVASGIEPHMGPRALVYTSLAVLLACTVWLVFFNRI